MEIVIIEDEQFAAEGLRGLILEYDSEIKVIKILSSVVASIEWFSSNPAPDLAFFDIQLADGLSFEIFNHVTIHCPIIFTTAYNEYAIQAFKVNSIDYLLKPIGIEDLSFSIDKFKNLKNQFQQLDFITIKNALRQLSNDYKKRFIVKVGEHIKSIPIEDILYFYSLEKASFMHLKNKHDYLIDFTMDQLEKLVDPELFFRINRKYLISLDGFEDIITYSNSRLKLNLIHSNEMDAIVAREKVKNFKIWLGK